MKQLQIIEWRKSNPFSDPELRQLTANHVRMLRAGREPVPRQWTKKTFENRWGDLPRKDSNYYLEWYPESWIRARVVTGKQRELFATTDHHRTGSWWQIIGL